MRIKKINENASKHLQQKTLTHVYIYDQLFDVEHRATRTEIIFKFNGCYIQFEGNTVTRNKMLHY